MNSVLIHSATRWCFGLLRLVFSPLSFLISQSALDWWMRYPLWSWGPRVRWCDLDFFQQMHWQCGFQMDWLLFCNRTVCMNFFDICGLQGFRNSIFIKLAKPCLRYYLQLAEAYREDLGRPKRCTVGTLSRLDQLGDSNKSIQDGLARLVELGTGLDGSNRTSEFDYSRSFGDL